MKKLMILLLILPVIAGCSQGEKAGTPVGSVKSTRYLDDTVQYYGTNEDALVEWDTSTNPDQLRVYAATTTAGTAVNIESSDGGIEIDANGATNGDISITADDNVIFTASGAMTISGTDSISFNESTISKFLRQVEVVTTQANAVTSAESGKVLVSSYTGTQTHTLPDAAAGLIYTVIDNSATAADDVIVDIQAGDNIEGDTNGDGLICTDDAVGSSVTLMAINGTRWIVLSTTGTWTAQ